MTIINIATQNKDRTPKTLNYKNKLRKQLNTFTIQKTVRVKSQNIYIEREVREERMGERSMLREISQKNLGEEVRDRHTEV